MERFVRGQFQVGYEERIDLQRLRKKRVAKAQAERDAGERGAALAAMLSIAVASGFAWAAGAALGGFYVASTVAGSLSPVRRRLVPGGGQYGGHAGARGLGLDHHRVGAFRLSAVLLLCGAAGLALLGADVGPAGLSVATAVVFATGWAYPGIVVFGIVRSNPAAPARATGIVLAGSACGGVVGPPAFGLAAQRLGYPMAWTGGGPRAPARGPDNAQR